MNAIAGAKVSKRRWSGVAVGVVAVAALLTGCGSGGGDSASPPTTKAAAKPKAPAGAKENAVAPVCYDLYKPTVQVGCAENTIGPGGGVIFYDAKTVQPWGRFLEVAPQKWNGALYTCIGSTYLVGKLISGTCGADAKLGIEAKTSDGGPNAANDTGKDGYGYRICGPGSKWNLSAKTSSEGWKASADAILPGAAANLPAAVGSGRSNTEVLRTTASCVNGEPEAVSVATAYRGGGLADWFLPSRDELVKLCQFGNRNAIGGFIGDSRMRYASSTSTTGAGQDHTNFVILTMNQPCDSSMEQTTAPMGIEESPINYGPGGSLMHAVRPIRAF